MAKNPKSKRKLRTKRDIAEKVLRKKQQQVKQAHRNIYKYPVGLFSPSDESLSSKLSNKKQLSPYVIKEREAKEKHRAEKAKAVMLRLLKERKKENERIKADELNRQKMDRLRTVYIESQLTKRMYKVPNFKAERYCTKWFIRIPKHVFKNQARLEREERKTIAINKLEESKHTVDIFETKKTEKKVEYTYDKSHAHNRDKTHNKIGKEPYTKEETVVVKEQVKVGEREIVIYGIPKEKVTARQRSTHNPFNGENRRDRRSKNNRKMMGNRYLKQQTLFIQPEGEETVIITEVNPIFEYRKEEYNSFEMVKEDGVLVHKPTVRERVTKVLVDFEDVTHEVTRPIRGYWKSFKTLALKGLRAKKMYEAKKEIEKLQKQAQDEKVQKEQLEKSQKVQLDEGEKATKSDRSKVSKPSEKRKDKASIASDKGKGGKASTSKRTKQGVKI